MTCFTSSCARQIIVCQSMPIPPWTPITALQIEQEKVCAIKNLRNDFAIYYTTYPRA